ncbi:MAG: glutamate--tRNA ligase [Desulfobacteraceae bacterium]
MDNVVVRFAPSPTGYLHIGGARTAIYNWLFARKHKGKFILRIEDTDAERSNMEAIQGILDGLQWLGLDWDEGPYFQSQFVAEHRAAAEALIEKGLAYKCFCTKLQLDEKREAARRNKLTYQYDGTCRHLTADEVSLKEASGQAYTIRIKVPRGTGAVVFNDAVYGSVEKKYQDIEDFIIVRGNGQPLYVLSNAVDDIRDGITHIIRGQDGLANTPKQILIYQGLGAALPEFAHMSLTLDPKKAKISKRKHGEQVAVHYYRENGFLPWAMVNFLVLLGWSTRDSQDIFSPDELINAFRLEGINRTNSVFNVAADGGKHFTDPKLISINAHYLRQMPMASLMPHIRTWLIKADLWRSEFDTEKRLWLETAMDLIRGRYNTLEDFVTFGKAYICDQFDVAPKAARKHLADPEVARWMPELAESLARLENYDAKSIESELRRFLTEKGIKAGKLMGAVRTAVTGQEVGPDFIKILTTLGRQCVVDRLKSVVSS